jgi:hypothetical protein
VAATLTDELTRVSVADIEKWDEGPDGTVYVYGRCTTPEVDTDEQVVDSGWSGPALKEYLATAPTVRVQHNPQRDPAGSAVRVDVNRDGDGAHWLKAAVDEPIAQRLVKRGHLRAFSVGIARPVIERDISGKARGGVIKGGKIVEVSLVDSPANRSCFLEIAKSAADGTCEFTGKIGGSDDFLAKALDGEVLTKAAAPAEDDLVNVDLPKGASISISPADFAALRTFKQQLVTKGATAVADAEKRDIGAADRRRIAGEGNAVVGADGHISYPIENAGDLENAATLARSGHGDVAAARRLIARRAKELGVANPLDEGDDVKKSENDMTVSVDTTLADERVKTLTAAIEKAADAPAEEQEAAPDVTKDPDPKPVKKAKKPKKLPPWLNKPKDDDGDSDDDDASKACKSVSDHLWTGVEGTSDIVCSKCHTTPAAAAGVTASAMNPAPVGDLMETPGPASVKGATPASASGAVGESMKPVPAHREPDGAPAEAFEADAGMSDGDSEKTATPDLAPDPEVAALLRFKATGTPEDLGRLHDLTCPAYSPEMAAKYHPYADLGSLIDAGAWQRKTLAAAAGPLDGALKMQEMWQAALLLKTAEPGDLNDWRLELHKAFRDANPGPGSFPTPGSVSPQRYARPCLTDGRAATAVDYGTPNTSPQVATGSPDAHSFDRPPLAGAHQSPSPSHMKWDSGQYPDETGVPTQLTYAQMQKEHQRMALVRMHDHLGRQFPEVCPLNTVNADGLEDRPLRGQQPEHHPVPVPAGLGKNFASNELIQANPEAYPRVPADLVQPEVPASVAASFKATPEEAGLFMDAEVYKGFKKMRKKLGKKVLSGKMTVDEARAKMGRQFAQKGADEAQEAVQKSAAVQVDTDVASAKIRELQDALDQLAVTKAAATDPEVIKAAVAEATSELKDLLVKQQETFTTKLAEQQKVIDAIADQPDPSTAAFSGLAFQPQVIKSRRPAAVPDIAESAARAQAMIRRNLENTYQTHSNPVVREKAAEALATFGVEAAPMT